MSPRRATGFLNSMNSARKIFTLTVFAAFIAATLAQDFDAEAIEQAVKQAVRRDLTEIAVADREQVFKARPVEIAAGQPGVLILRPDKEQKLAAPTNAAPTLHPSQEGVLLRNGDILIGALQTIQSNIVTWKHPDAAAPVQLKVPSIAELQVKAEPRTHAESTNACLVRLTNDDQLEGELLSLDASQIALKTWYAGELRFPRNLVQSIHPPAPSRSTIYEGPTGLEGWTLGKTTAELPNQGQWAYRNGAFYATRAASIARDVHLPDVSSIQFDLTWKGYFQLAIALYSDSLQPVSLANKESAPDFGGFYSLQLNTFSANLLPITKNDPIRYLGQASLLTLSQKSRAHIDIRPSKARHSITLLVNGELVREWIDPAEFAGRGSAVRFVHQGQGAVKIENIKVSEWDGLFEDKETPPPPAKQDLAKLRNGDRASGNIATIQDGLITMSVLDRKLEIPFTRAKELAFARERSTRPNALPNDVRAFFTRGGSLSLQVEKWDSESLIATSPIFGKATFHPRAFNRFEFIPPTAN